MDPDQARDEICRVGRSLFERGLVHATAGNISMRLDAAHGGGMLITPTDACLGFLDPARLAHVDAQGRQLGGDAASKTLALHRAIDAAAGERAGCVLHTHSRHAVALTLRSDAPAAELLPPITPYFVMKVGHVPLLPYRRPGDPQTVSEAIAAIAAHAARGTPIRALMLPRLGPVVWHATPAAAMALLEEIEETAALIAMSPQAPAPLDDAQIEALRRAFGASW